MCTCITPALDPPPAAIADDVETIRAQINHALTTERQGDTERSFQIADQARAAAARLSYRPLHAEALVQVARALDGRQTADARTAAEALYFEALGIAEAVHHDQLAAVIWRRLVLLAIRMEAGTGQARERLSHLEEAVSQIGNCACGQAKLHHLRGEIHDRDGDHATAAAEKQRAIDAITSASGDHAELGSYYHALAKSLEQQGQLGQALGLYARAQQIAGQPGEIGASLPDRVELHMNHALALKRSGNLAGARAELEAAQAQLPAACRGASLNAGVLETFLSDVAYQAGDAAEALMHGRRARDIYRQIGAPDHRLAEAHTNIANAELKRRNFQDAVDAYQDALELRLQHLGEHHYQVGVNHGSLAEALVALARRDEATLHLEKAERILASVSPENREIQDWIQSIRGQLVS